MGIFDRLDRLADQLGDLIVPDDVRAHVELGAAYLERGDLDSAIHELSWRPSCAPSIRAPAISWAWRWPVGATI